MPEFTMTTEQILIAIEQANCELSATRHCEAFMRPNNWHLTLAIKHEGSTLTVHKQGSLFEDTLLAAWTQFEQIAKRGLPIGALAAPIDARQ